MCIVSMFGLLKHANALANNQCAPFSVHNAMRTLHSSMPMRIPRRGLPTTFPPSSHATPAPASASHSRPPSIGARTMRFCPSSTIPTRADVTGSGKMNQRMSRKFCVSGARSENTPCPKTNCRQSICSQCRNCPKKILDFALLTGYYLIFPTGHSQCLHPKNN